MKSTTIVLRTLCLSLAVAAGCATSAPTAVRRHLLPGTTGDLPFSHVVEAGDTVHVAGTLGLDPATGQPPADPAEEARLLLDEVRAKLRVVGLTMDDLVSVQVFCSDVELYTTFNDVYRTYFSDGFPARSFLGSGPLLRGCRFELNGIAAR